MVGFVKVGGFDVESSFDLVARLRLRCSRASRNSISRAEMNGASKFSVDEVTNQTRPKTLLS